MKQKYPFYIVTGPSGSGKTTLVNRLLSETSLRQPTQFTTRRRRFEKELDDYVFLERKDFLMKLNNGDFAEYTEYNGNLYAISRGFYNELSDNAAIDAISSRDKRLRLGPCEIPEGMRGPMIAIMEPIGREMLTKFLVQRGITPTTVYLDIDEKTMIERLGIKRRDSYEEIVKRLSDLKYFGSYQYDHVIDAKGSPAETYDEFLRIMASWGS